MENRADILLTSMAGILSINIMHFVDGFRVWSVWVVQIVIGGITLYKLIKKKKK